MAELKAKPSPKATNSQELTGQWVLPRSTWGPFCKVPAHSSECGSHPQPSLLLHLQRVVVAGRNSGLAWPPIAFPLNPTTETGSCLFLHFPVSTLPGPLQADTPSVHLSTPLLSPALQDMILCRFFMFTRESILGSSSVPLPLSAMYACTVRGNIHKPEAEPLQEARWPVSYP